MVKPRRRQRLKSKTVTYTFDLVKVEGFTRDEKGNDVPNGIECVMATNLKIASIK
jgi:hypothetical protein